ncbi:MAG: FAD-dependent thymidylate synthase, partial [Calditrichia bacterium]
KEWLNEQYNVHSKKIEDIAKSCGVSYHTIRKWIRKHGVQHTKGGRSKTPWNKAKKYKLGSRELSDRWLEANRKSRAGKASNFWKGGVSTDRENIGRWTTQIAPKIHERNQWTCQLCHQRKSKLHCHHIVPVWADESLARNETNLTTICKECHLMIKGKELEFIELLGGPPVKKSWKKRPRIPWNKLTIARLVQIKKFEFIGEKETYDLEVQGPYHNFIANGIVTHNSVNEYSTRYSIAIDATQTTAPGEWRLQAAQNRQGSEGFLDEKTGREFSRRERELQDYCRKEYEARLEAGIAREQARKDLPLSTYTEAYWKIDLHNLLHFLALRMDEHAQYEIRCYAKIIGEEILAKWCPITWEAFLDYRMNSVPFSGLELAIIKDISSGTVEGARARAEEIGWLSRREDGSLKRHRERAEFEEKLAGLNIKIPWA